MKTLMVTCLLVLVSTFSFSQTYSSIFSSQQPVAITKNDGQALELGLKFRSSSSGFIAGIRFYKTSGNTGTHTGELYDNAGNRLGSAVFTNESATGWQTVLFNSPVAIAANTTYVAAYHSAGGYFTGDDSYFDNPLTNGPLTALQDGMDGSNGLYGYGASPAFPAQQYLAANYWVDVLFSAGQVTVNQPPIVNAGIDKSIAVSASPLVLSGTASDPDGTIASLAWTKTSGPNTPILSGNTTATLAISGMIAGTYIYRLTATDNKGATAYDEVQVTVNAAATTLTANAGSNQAITVPASSVTLNGSGSTGSINSYSWTRVSGPNRPSITSSKLAITTVTGLIQGTYVFKLSVNGGASTSQVTVTVSAATATVTANAGSSQSVTLPASSVTLSGSGSTGTISNYTWTGVSGPNTPFISTPTAASTTVTGLVQGTYVFQLSVNGGASTSQVTIAVVPGTTTATTTIFTTQTPGSAVSNDGQAIELGVKFRSTAAGYITGIRFYKVTGNTGTHTGELYSSSGVRLAQAVFTAETSSGWQQVLFSAPVAIAANTTYIGAYYSSAGNFSSTLNYFTTAVTNSPLSGLADGTDGVNGVYAYSATPAFPNTSYMKSNYWVDAIFSSGTSQVPANQVPVVNAGADKNITLPTSSIVLSGTATDANGTIASLAWTETSGPNTPTLTGAATATAAITGLIAGTYVYRLTATDNNGATAFDEVQVTVNSAVVLLSPGTLSAGADQTLSAGTTSTTLTGNVSTAATTAGAVASDTVNLIVIQGESNAAGNADNSLALASELLSRSTVKIYNHVTNKFEDLHVGVNNEQDTYIDATHHGLELGLANQVDSGHFANPAYLVKIGVSGSYISQWLPGDSRDLWGGWMPFVDNAVNALKAAGIKYRIIVWQSIGLNDRFGQATNVDSFQARMQRYRTAFRNRYNTPNIHFFSTNFNNPPTSTFDWVYVWPKMALADPLFHEISVYGTTYISGDISHWDHDGFKLIAKRMVDATNQVFASSVSGIGGSAVGTDKLKWNKVAGPAAIIVSPTSNSTVVNGLIAGTYTFELIDTTSSGIVYKDSVNVTVQSASGSGGGTGTATGTTTSFTTLTTDFMRPGAGAENWGQRSWDNSTSPQIPSGNSSALNYYDRFNWIDIESSTTQGSYNWSIFDAKVNNAIDNGAMFSFGIMTMCTACGLTGYGYPTYLHNLMQAEGANSQDWQNSTGDWVINWNSPNFLARFEALLNAIAAHINSTSRNGKNYKDAIYYVDIRGFGDFGEWHTYPWTSQQPAGRQATSVSLKRIIDAHITAFPNYPLMIPMGAFEQGSPSQVPGDVGIYALTTTNNWGQIGWRRDNWGDDGYDNYLRDNGYSYNGQAYAPLIMNKYKYGIVGGEPANDLNGVSRNPPGDGTPFGDLVREIQLYHAASFGNGNYPISASNTSLQTNIGAASKAAGYRVLVDSLKMNNTINPGTVSGVTLYWKNSGTAPVYEDWNIEYQLRDGTNAIKYSQVSAFSLKLFYNASGSSAYTDSLSVPAGLTAGTYSLVLMIKDPKGYKAPLPLAITGRAADGSYLLRTVTISAAAAGQRIADSAAVTTQFTDRAAVATGNLSNTLSQNYPNPVSGSQSTIINYSIAAGGKVELALYDVLGIQVKVLVNETKQAGTYMYTLDTKGLRKGTYFYKIRSGNYSSAKTLLVQ